jgi:hypothetical protein
MGSRQNGVAGSTGPAKLEFSCADEVFEPLIVLFGFGRGSTSIFDVFMMPATVM